MKDSHGFRGRERLRLLAIGAVAGAMAMYVAQALRDGQSSAGALAGGDLIRKAAQKLQECCDSLVESIDKSRPS